MHLRSFAIAVLATVAFIHCDSRQDSEPLGAEHEALCTAGFAATWQQGSGANEWWVEYTIGGATITSAYLEVPGGTNVTLAARYDKWAASSARIPTGTTVILHATSSTGASAQSTPFAYLATTAPATDPCSAPQDAGTDGGSCGAWAPAITQGSGANDWWVEYTIAGGTTASASLEVVGGVTVPLSAGAGKWRGSPSQEIPSGTSVILHAQDTDGHSVSTTTFRYLVDTTPALAPCVSDDAGAPPNDAGACSSYSPTWQQGSGANEWWIEYAIASATSASLSVAGGATVPLSLHAGKWSASTAKINSGTTVTLHAADASGASADTSPFPYLVDTTPVTAPCTGNDGGSTGDGGATSGDPYDANQVLTYEFGFDDAAMAVLTDTDPSTEDTWVHGTFRQGDTYFADVGFRRKGSSTFRALPQKAALKVRFDKYVKTQTWNGLTDLTLNNEMSDPTFLVERLSYYVFRSAGLPAERAATAHVVINGENYGVYANVETPDDQLNDRLFGANANNLYEVNYGSQWLPGVDGGFEQDAGDDESYSDLHALFDAVQAANDATLLDDVAGVLHTDEWLKFSATEGIVGDYDGYGFGHYGSHNYYMASDLNGRFSLVPWSLDLTMSERDGGVNTNEPATTSDGEQTLLVRCKNTTACWSAYKDQVRAVLGVYDTLGLSNLARTWHAEVDPYVTADPKKEISNSYYESQSTTLFDWLDGRPAVVRAQLGL